MCGICGFNWEDKTLAKKMAWTLEHRGPDHDGYYTDRNISLGHKRLSIIDLSEKGKQPMHNEDSSIWIIYNGEIYNFMHLRQELEKKGHRFYSNTDTEAVIHAYEEFGEECVQKFNGMFSFAIWDLRQKKLFCSRDRLGIKPFYYYWDGNKFIFASEIKAILQHPVKRAVDETALSYYLAYTFIPGENSIFQNIYKLMPGTSLVLKENKIKIKKYWNPDFSDKINADESYFIKKINECLDASVKRRMIADVPVGAFLSGGIDSSAVVAKMSKMTSNLKTFSVSFDVTDYDESKYSSLIAEKFSTDHHSFHFKAGDILKHISFISSHYDEPLADSSIVPTYIISKIARKHVKVALTGEGGDESFAGYDRYNAFKQLRFARRLPKIFRKKSQSFAFEKEHLINKLAKKASIFLEYSGMKNYEIYSKTWSNIGIEPKNELLSKKNDFKIHNHYKPFFKYRSFLDNSLNSDINNYLPSDLLKKVDMSSMAVSLEARVPFLDHEFIEFTCRIPSYLKIKHNEKKYILKKALKGILPDEILYRKKKGFDIPMEHYFKSELKSFVHDLLTSQDFIKRKIFNQDKINKLIEQHMSGRKNNKQAIFSLIMLEQWFRKWVD